MKYPYLPEGRSFTYVPISDPFMSEAKRLALAESTDTQQPTSAVIVRDGEIIGYATNRSALKNKWLMDFHRNKFCVRRFFKIPTGKGYWTCPGCAAPRLHAEPRAIKDAKKKGNSVGGADLYHWGHFWCCKPCWDSMIAAGIRNVFLVEGATELFTRKP